ncbi:MAG: TonB-dependent receptor, partial [Alphaproteobacteria bacterium]|nr:TonB-dependent receptor [Alphaproteobacteria bacterium]
MRPKASFRTRFFLGAAFSVITLSGAAIAQEGENQEDLILTNTEEETEGDESRQETVTVIGSRLKRDEYSSIAPVQVIQADVQRDKGLVDATSILQSTSASAGQQIDASFAGFVLDNGPGATTADLRGLGPGRTLTLLNGRRLAPAGVEGAPSSPDLNLIPGGLVESYDLLLDGASSIYGSDAVAGVINATLRKDFDGLEIEAFRTMPEDGGGEETQINLTWGVNGDRGFAGFGAEFFDRTTIRLSDRGFSNQCERNVEITEDGEIRNTDVSLPLDFPGMGESPCDYFPLASRLSVRSLPGGNQYGSLYYTPGSTNTGIPNFSESGLFGAVVDGNGDGLADFSFYDYTTNGTKEDRAADLVAGVETLSLFSYGEYTLENDITAYYEASFAQRESEINSGLPQLFPIVPADNPFNICNIEAGGSDCGALYNQSIVNIFGAPLSAFGLVDAVEGVNYDVQPIVTVRGDRGNTSVDVAQYRAVAGFKGDLPFEMPVIGHTWDYDVYASYSRSDGSSIRRGVRDDRLQLSLSTTIEDPDNPGQFICGLDVDGDGVPDPSATPGGCVPINMFAPSLYETRVGDFETPEQRDFVLGRRTFDTVYEQTVLSAVTTGDLFELPGGTAAGAVGFEYRQDTIDSRPDDVAADGLFFGFFNDQGASGSKDLYEAFAEIELPIVANQPGFYELTTNLSGRWTEEEFYGAAWTYSGKLGWRPVEFIQVSGTVGTSFRAPNVREQFLR